MNRLNFPLDFQFKIFTPSNDFSVFNAQGEEIAYTRQKIFKIKENIEIFRDGSRAERLYQINADRIIDFNACYHIQNELGQALGSVRRAGMRSLWRTHYEIFDVNNLKILDIQEENPWVSVADTVLNQIPILGWFSGYFLNPCYLVRDANGEIQYTLRKISSFMERRFCLAKMGDAPFDELAVLSCMMLMLLERYDG